MDIDRFLYKLWYILFPIGLIDLKLTGCTHGGVVNIYAKFELFEQNKILCEFWGF